MPGIFLGNAAINKTCKVSFLLIRKETNNKQDNKYIHSTSDGKIKQYKVNREYGVWGWMVLFYTV